ncbi:MAG: glycosyltransferase family 2 protein [Candidatus Neomarinimicrobiota bacterium]|jgi:glycosyltransferase involved in cell wall biosynthesis|nr:glycosyltransferase family 2 protein [Candidatus Neomarinimicrobiota bacterium]
MNKNISVIVPVFNESESLKDLYAEIIYSIEDKFEYEIIFIDDGSTDNSHQIIEELIDVNHKVKLIRFSKNYGKADALSEAFLLSKGEYVITMDADLQDDPHEITNLINKLEEGWDMVSGWKKNRNDPLEKKIPSKIFNKITCFFTGVKIHDFNCGLKAYKREVVKSIELYGGLHRYIPAIAKQMGFSITEIPVNHRKRKFGKSKYGSERYFHGFFDLLTVLFLGNYLRKPLHFFGKLGLIMFSMGSFILIYLTYGWFNGIWIGDRPLFFLGILLIILSVQFFSIGLLGDIIVRLVGQNKNRVLEIIAKGK